MANGTAAVLSAALLVLSLAAASAPVACAGAATPRPLIIDTDIGTDFDDSAALALALSSPDDYDIRLVLSATGDTTRRAQIIARYLDLYGRTEVDVGVGVNTTLRAGALWGWAESYPLSKYPGTVYTDGVGQAINIIKSSPVPVLILAIAPASNFPSLLQRCPECAANAEVFAMSGSIYKGYGNSTTPSHEYNVAEDPPGSQAMYTAAWHAPMTATPLDTCGTATLYNAPYDILTNGTSLTSAVLVQSLLFWSIHNNVDLHKNSDIWYDAVACTMGMQTPPTFLNFKPLRITVTDDGATTVDPTHGSLVMEALSWTPDDVSGEYNWAGFAASRIAAGTSKARSEL